MREKNEGKKNEEKKSVSMLQSGSDEQDLMSNCPVTLHFPHFSMVLCHFEILHFPGNSSLKLQSKSTVLNRNSDQNSVNS